VASTHKKPPAKSSKTAEYTDAWGCVWHSPQKDSPPELKHSPLAEPGKIATFQPPAALLERPRFAKVNKSCQATSRFVLAWSEVRPFDRLRFLRGETTLVELARGTKDIRGLLEMLHDFACKELELWAATDVDGVVFYDDWGTADGLLVATEMWRDMFRPLYREYCKILHAKDKFVFFHSNGHILDIFGDLVRAGVDAIHCQMDLMGVERLAKRYRGRVTFWAKWTPAAHQSGHAGGVPRGGAGRSPGVGLRQRRGDSPMPVGARRANSDCRRFLRAVASTAADARVTRERGKAEGGRGKRS